MPQDHSGQRPSPGRGLQPESCTSICPCSVAAHPWHLPSAFYLHVSLHPQCCMWITLKIVLSRCEVDGDIQSLIRQLKEITRRRKVCLAGIGIRQEVHVMYPALQCEPNHVTAMHFEFRRLEIVALRVAVELDDHDFSCRSSHLATRGRRLRRRSWSSRLALSLLFPTAARADHQQGEYDKARLET